MLTSRFAIATFLAGVGLVAFGPLAEAGQPAPSDNHGQCVSSSEKPSGKGGRSETARDKNGCPAPTPDPTNTKNCQVTGNATPDTTKDTVTVTGTGPDSAGSSYECDTSIPVTEGQTISFDYTLGEGTAPCGGGVPRLFVVIDGTAYNTFDDNPNSCEATTGSLTLPVTGTVTHIGLVYDRQDYGSVTYSNVKIGDTTLNF